MHALTALFLGDVFKFREHCDNLRRNIPHMQRFLGEVGPSLSLQDPNSVWGFRDFGVVTLERDSLTKVRLCLPLGPLTVPI